MLILTELQELILDKTQTRLDHFGFKKTTMDEISHDCKISKKTLYANFKNKEYLFTCLLQRERRKTTETICAQLCTINNPQEKLIQLVKTTIIHLNEDSFFARIWQKDPLFCSSLLSGKPGIDEEITAMIASIIIEGQAQGKFRAMDATLAAYAGFKLFQAFSCARTISFSPEKDSQGYYTNELINLFMHGILNQPHS